MLLYSHHIDELVGSLETCEYHQPRFREVLDKLQKMIDDLNLRSYSNLRQWVFELDRQVCPGFSDFDFDLFLYTLSARRYVLHATNIVLCCSYWVRHFLRRIYI